MHEAERGEGTWDKALDGLRWLSDQRFPLAIAGRVLPHESSEECEAGYHDLLARLGITLDGGLVVFPQMDATRDVAEISEGCWDILGLTPSSVMCASSRMVVKRKGSAEPEVVACTLLPYDPRFSLGTSLAEASRDVALNHPHCARFCVLGGASCSG